LEPARQKNRRPQGGCAGRFFAVFLPHSWILRLQIWQKLASLGPPFAIAAFCRAASQQVLLHF
jgi:hypothetical protein